MTKIDILLFIISISLGFIATKEVFMIKKANSKEADRFLKKLSNRDFESEEFLTNEHSTGLSLVKTKKEEKYSLIAQSKLTGLGLS